MKRKFRIVEYTGNGSSAEYIGSYPDFNSVEEGLDYIARVLDPYYTGHYGISVTPDQELTTPKKSV